MGVEDVIVPLPQRTALSDAEEQRVEFEQTEETVLLSERQFEGLPQGFQTNMIDDERLESLSKTFSSANRTTTASGRQVFEELSSTVSSIAEPSDVRFTEEDAIDLVVDRAASAYALPERTISLPGVELNRKLIKAAAIAFKRDTDTPSGTIKPPELATADDLVVEFATPDVYNDITGTADQADNFIRTGLNTDQALDVIGGNGAAGGAGTLGLRASEWLFYTGDIVDPLDDASLTKWRFADVDGDTSFGPTPAILGRRASSLHVQTINAHLVKEQVDLNARVYDAGTANEAEPVPIAFRFADGSDAQPLQD